MKYYLVQRNQKIVKNRSPITHVRAIRHLPLGEQVRGLVCYTAKLSAKEEERLNSRPWRSDFYISNNRSERVAWCFCIFLFHRYIYLGTARFVNISGANNARLEEIGGRMHVRVRGKVYIFCDSANMILIRLHNKLEKERKYVSALRTPPLILLRMLTKQARCYLETS